MKLSINLNDAVERDNAKAILAMFDDEPTSELVEEEVTYLPDDEPQAEPEPQPEPEPQAEPEPEPRAKAQVPTMEAKPVPTLAEAQEMAKRLVREQGFTSDDIVALFSPFGVSKISDLSDQDRVSFVDLCQEKIGEANV